MSNVIETMFLDGPHWYGGLRRKEKEGEVIEGVEWTPYFEDARRMNLIEGNTVMETLFAKMGGVRLIPEHEALKQDARNLKKYGTVQVDEIRAKYMQVGDIVRLPGFTSKFLVKGKDNNNFALVNVTNQSKPTYVGINSDKWVLLVGKKTEELKEVKK